MTSYTLGAPVRILGAVAKIREQITWRPQHAHRIYSEAVANWPQIKAADGRADGYGLLRTSLVDTDPPADRGLIIGKRSIQQGVTDYDTDGHTAPTFFPCERTTIYLVAYHLCRRPIMCLPGQIAPETETDHD